MVNDRNNVSMTCWRMTREEWYHTYQGSSKAWLWKHGWLPRLLWSWMPDEVSMTTVKEIKMQMNKYFCRWPSIPQSFTNVQASSPWNQHVPSSSWGRGINHCLPSRLRRPPADNNMRCGWTWQGNYFPHIQTSWGLAQLCSLRSQRRPILNEWSRGKMNAQSSERKATRYKDMVQQCSIKVWQTWQSLVKVGCRGFQPLSVEIVCSSAESRKGSQKSFCLSLVKEGGVELVAMKRWVMTVHHCWATNWSVLRFKIANNA